MADRTELRDALAEELLSAFGITIQDDQEHVADVFMERLWPLIDTGVVYVEEGWWHPNTKSGQVHDHPEHPNGAWSIAHHRLCWPVYTRRTPRAEDLGQKYLEAQAAPTVLSPEDEVLVDKLLDRDSS